MDLPAQDLVCPEPRRCPVVPVEDLPELNVARFGEGMPLHRVYDGTWGYDEPNPGFGDARFSPFDALGGGHRVPTLYLAETQTGALLETVFHDVHQDADRLVWENDLRRMLLAHVRIPAPLRLVDLRDEALGRAGIERGQIVSTPAEHYPCTRRVGRHLHGVDVEGKPVQGILWHSRQAELCGRAPGLTMVVFADRYAAARGDWVRTGPGSQNLLEGPGRMLVDELALQLGATMVIT